MSYVLMSTYGFGIVFYTPYKVSTIVRDLQSSYRTPLLRHSNFTTNSQYSPIEKRISIAVSLLLLYLCVCVCK